MKQIFSTVIFLAVAAAVAIYFINRPSYEERVLGSFQNAVEEFRIDYSLLEEGAKNHPRGEEFLNRVREREGWLSDDNEANDRDAYELIAFDMRQLGDDEGAILSYRASIALFENNIASYGNLATSYRETEQYEKAEAAYKKVTELNPGDVSNYRALSDLYLYSITNNKDKIPSVIEQGLQRVPGHPDLLSYLAVFYQNEGENDKAIEYYRKLLQVAPLNSSAKAELEKLEAAR